MAWSLASAPSMENPHPSVILVTAVCCKNQLSIPLSPSVCGVDVGLDDNWQKCGHYGPDGLTYHDEDGNPIVNTERFPNMKDMTDHAHKLGLTAGWYGNNCICSDHKIGDRKFYEGDVKALRGFGFDAWKLDGCGAQTDMQLWDDGACTIDHLSASHECTLAVIKASGKPLVVENCHWGSKVPYKPNATWCPWNLYR